MDATHQKLHRGKSVAGYGRGNECLTHFPSGLEYSCDFGKMERVSTSEQCYSSMQPDQQSFSSQLSFNECVHIRVSICHVSAGVCGSQTGYWISWSWSYRGELWLWAPYCGCWEPNLGLLQEQQLLLTTDPSVQAQKPSVIFYLLPDLLSVWLSCYENAYVQ